MIKIGLLIYSIITLFASIYLIRENVRLGNLMTIYHKNVGYIDYLVTGLFGYLGLPASIFGVVTCTILLFIGG